MSNNNKKSPNDLMLEMLSDPNRGAAAMDAYIRNLALEENVPLEEDSEEFEEIGAGTDTEKAKKKKKKKNKQKKRGGKKKSFAPVPLVGLPPVGERELHPEINAGDCARNFRLSELKESFLKFQKLIDPNLGHAKVADDPRFKVLVQETELLYQGTELVNGGKFLVSFLGYATENVADMVYSKLRYSASLRNIVHARSGVFSQLGKFFIPIDRVMCLDTFLQEKQEFVVIQEICRAAIDGFLSMMSARLVFNNWQGGMFVSSVDHMTRLVPSHGCVILAPDEQPIKPDFTRLVEVIKKFFGTNLPEGFSRYCDVLSRPSYWNLCNGNLQFLLCSPILFQPKQSLLFLNNLCFVIQSKPRRNCKNFEIVSVLLAHLKLVGVSKTNWESLCLGSYVGKDAGKLQRLFTRWLDRSMKVAQVQGGGPGGGGGQAGGGWARGGWARRGWLRGRWPRGGWVRGRGGGARGRGRVTLVDSDVVSFCIAVYRHLNSYRDSAVEPAYSELEVEELLSSAFPHLLQYVVDALFVGLNKPHQNLPAEIKSLWALNHYSQANPFGENLVDLQKDELFEVNEDDQICNGSDLEELIPKPRRSSL